MAPLRERTGESIGVGVGSIRYWNHQVDIGACTGHHGLVVLLRLATVMRIQESLGCGDCVARALAGGLAVMSADQSDSAWMQNRYELAYQMNGFLQLHGLWVRVWGGGHTRHSGEGTSSLRDGDPEG